MVISLKLNKSQFPLNSSPNKKESSEPLQAQNTKPQNDQILSNSPINQKDILVTVDDDYLRVLGKKLIKHYEEKNKRRQQDGTIHIFEITDCLRKSLILQQYPEEARKLTIYDTMNFDHGLKSETVLVDVLESQKDHAVSTEYQYDINFEGISGHPDFIEGDWVFELKSVNKFKPLILSDSTVTGYIRQVVYYMILMGIDKGRIIVKYNLPFFPVKMGEIVEDENFPNIKTPIHKLEFHKDTGQFPFFNIQVTIPKDAPIREKVKNGLLNVVKPLYKQGDISKFPRLDGCLEGQNFKCMNFCKVRDKCLELADEQYDPDIRGILLNKHIDSQMDKVRNYGKRRDKNVDCS